LSVETLHGPAVGFEEVFVGATRWIVSDLMNRMLFPDVDGSWCSTLSKFDLYFRYSLTATLHNVPMDEVSLQFHIKKNDYFGTLATVLDLISQNLRKKGTFATLKLSCVCETG